MSACCDKSESSKKQKTPISTAFSIALVGNPNCGKTTLFNALTGATQKVGNWPGVTVERKSGFFTSAQKTVEVIDLPGVYSLILASDSMAIDERIACEFVLKQQANVIVNIVDASNLERHLYLTTQLLELGVPVVLALNMMDVAEARGIQIDVAKLARELGCPVIALAANQGRGIDDLKRAVIDRVAPARRPRALVYPDSIQQAIAELTTAFSPFLSSTHHIVPAWFAMRLLENDKYAQSLLHFAAASSSPACCASLGTRITTLQTRIQETAGEDADILLADARYQFVQHVVAQCITHATHVSKTTWTTRLDHILLNRILGVPIFLGVMYCLFFFSINIGGAFQDFFDMSSETIFVNGFAYLLTNIGAPTWLTVLLANGVGKGINTTVTFIPVIGAMFLFLALLEDSGYMARAAFVVDRFMRALGLPGKAFVPMIVGFGCNVPAVMAARTLENKRDRILTIMMSPFMSCGARLAIYAVFTAAFFPRGGQNIVFALYLIGIFMAIFTGFILRHTLLKGEPSPLVMELPPYHVPHLKSLGLHAWQRLKAFIFRAGKLIIPICILIGALNSLNMDGSMNAGEGDTRSLLSVVGQWLTPVFAPMGIQANNWPATVGLVTGILAKEVVVGTLNTLYTQMGQFATATGADGFQLWAGLQEAFASIPANFAALADALSNPFAKPTDPLAQGVYGLMYQQFDGRIGAFAYLLFVLLYFPCISTTAAMLRELHRGWSIFSICWMTGIAYGVAVIFYQAATWSRHPFSSFLWVSGLIAAFFITIGIVQWIANRNDARRLTPIISAGELG